MGKLEPEEKVALGILSIVYGLSFPFVWLYKTIFEKEDTETHTENPPTEPPKPNSE